MADKAPALVDRFCDIEIPKKVWASWTPEHGRRVVIRALSDTERTSLVLRAADLSAAVAPFSEAQVDRVAAAVSDMFSGWRSVMRNYSDEAVIATVASVKRMLAPLPAWAIEEGCMAIQRGQAGLKREFVPNDNEIFAVVDKIVEPYRKALRQAEALLAAPVEPPAPVKAFIAPPDKPVQPDPTADGKHAERVKADLAARKAARTASETVSS